jgi:hypothetical protein
MVFLPRKYSATMSQIARPESCVEQVVGHVLQDPGGGGRPARRGPLGTVRDMMGWFTDARTHYDAHKSKSPTTRKVENDARGLAPRRRRAVRQAVPQHTAFQDKD